MWTKPYGSTGKDVTVVSFGGMRFAQPQNIDANAEIVLHAYNRGINYFDTAPGYCADKSEDIMGAAFRQMDREKFYCSTKSNKPEAGKLRADLERSLERLGVETIDFYHIWCLVHPGQYDQRQDGGAIDEALKAKEEGLVNHVVVSSHLGGTELADVLDKGPFEGVTLGYCALNAAFREQAVQAAGRMDLGVVTMNPLGGGMIPQNAERLRFLKGPDDPSVTAAAIRFNVSHPDITSALVGFTTQAHIDEAVDAVEGFEPWSAARQEEVRTAMGREFNELCTGCGYCLPCPEGVEIPKLMDVYNQRILHDSDKSLWGRLKWHWNLSPDNAAACSLCGACEEKCTQHLPIRERLEAVKQIEEPEKG